MCASLRKAGIPPHAGPGTRLLILGSLPGERSLAQQQYYAHPRNLFWHLAGAVTGLDLAALPYPERLAGLATAGVGLWDVIASGERRGSLDSAIRGAAANPLAVFCSSLPHLRVVAFNGQKAAAMGAPLLADLAMPLVILPSSSPANAAVPLAEKEQRWLELRKFL